jgi:hypothetical protein
MILSAWTPRFYPCMMVHPQTDCTIAFSWHLPTTASHRGRVPYCEITSSAFHPHGTLVQCSSALFGSPRDPPFARASQESNSRRTLLKRRDPFYMGSSSAEVETRAALKSSVQGERASNSVPPDQARSNHKGNSHLLTLEDVKETAKAR